MSTPKWNAYRVEATAQRIKGAGVGMKPAQYVCPHDGCTFRTISKYAFKRHANATGHTLS